MHDAVSLVMQRAMAKPDEAENDGWMRQMIDDIAADKVDTLNIVIERNCYCQTTTAAATLVQSVACTADCGTGKVRARYLDVFASATHNNFISYPTIGDHLDLEIAMSLRLDD